MKGRVAYSPVAASASSHPRVHSVHMSRGGLHRDVQENAVARGLPALVYLAGTVTCDLWVSVLYQLAVQHPLTCGYPSMVNTD